MVENIIEVKNVYKSFSGNRVLNDISFSIRAGEILCLVGENGSGKSTLIKIISGDYSPDSGSVTLQGHEYLKLHPSISIREGVHVIYQDFSVFENLTVAENIALSAQLINRKQIFDWKRLREDAQKALDMIGTNLDLDREVGTLSVAQKQLVAIARAMAHDAKLIIMDEATTALTHLEINRLYDIINALAKKGVAVVFVSHKLDEVLRVSQRIVVLRNGNMVVDQQIEDFDKSKLVYYMTGQEIRPKPFVYEPQGNEPVIELQGVSLAGHLNDISFELKKGEILGIVGQLGSGRTELAKVLFGIEPIDGGTIKIKGEEVSFQTIGDALDKCIAYVPEDRLSEGLLLERSISDNMNMVIVDQQVTKRGLIDHKRFQEVALQQIDALSINAPSVEVPAGTFSGGNQQRIVLGKWLATNPEFFVLNGPTVGVDVKSKNEIHNVIKQLSLQGISFIIISDDIAEIMTTSNRVLVINDGKITYRGETAQTDADTLTAEIIRSS